MATDNLKSAKHYREKSRERQLKWKEAQLKAGKKAVNVMISKEAQDAIAIIKEHYKLSNAGAIEKALTFLVTQDASVTKNALDNIATNSDTKQTNVTKSDHKNVSGNVLKTDKKISKSDPDKVFDIIHLMKKNGKKDQEICDHLNENGMKPARADKWYVKQLSTWYSRNKKRRGGQLGAGIL